MRKMGWAMWDSNPHGLRHQILSLACLPISAIARCAEYPVWPKAELPSQICPVCACAQYITRPA